jgi:F0F1-type ATP synthase assembly protein I
MRSRSLNGSAHAADELLPSTDLYSLKAAGSTRERRRTRFAIAGAVIGVAFGILVSVTTDIPLAPEVGLLLGAVAGWFSATAR